MAEDRGQKGFWIWDFGFAKSEGQKRKEQCESGSEYKPLTRDKSDEGG